MAEADAEAGVTTEGHMAAAAEEVDMEEAMDRRLNRRRPTSSERPLPNPSAGGRFL